MLAQFQIYHPNHKSIKVNILHYNIMDFTYQPALLVYEILFEYDNILLLLCWYRHISGCDINQVCLIFIIDINMTEKVIVSITVVSLCSGPKFVTCLLCSSHLGLLYGWSLDHGSFSYMVLSPSKEMHPWYTEYFQLAKISIVLVDAFQLLGQFVTVFL